MAQAILILSGGQSRRMGRDKSLLPYQGNTLLNWQCSRFKAAGYQVVSNLNDRYSGFLGPLAGIDSAIHQYPNIKHWLVVPVDMPKLSLSTVRHLFEQGARCGVAVAFEQSPLPIYIPCQANLASTLDAWLSDKNGKRSVFALHNAMNGQWLDGSEFLEDLKNYNTPEQWQSVLSN